MNETRYLILTYHNDAYFFPYLTNDAIIVREPINTKSKIAKILFRIPLLSQFSYRFKKELSNVDKVVVFDSAYNKLLGKYLKKRCKNVFLYFWNPISKEYPKNSDKMISEAKALMPIYSFDHNDCIKYNLEYRSMVYSSDVKFDEGTNHGLQYDLFFLGWVKDRRAQIEELYNNLFKGKLKCLFILVGEEEKTVDDNIFFTRRRVPYREYLQYIQKSKAILDIPQEGQEGLTIRNVESIFLRKKMITTNVRIKDYDLYNKQNTFILFEDNIEEIESFISSKYCDLDSMTIQKYDFQYWIRTFGEST